MHPFTSVEGKLVCTLQHIAIRKRKDCRGANASSTPTESGIEHSVQVILAETVHNSAEPRKAENAFKEKIIPVSYRSCKPWGAGGGRHKRSLLQSQLF